MKKLLKTTLAAGVLLSAACSLSAAGIIMTDKGKEIKTTNDTRLVKGKYRYTEDGAGKKITKSIDRKDVQWAWIPKPKEIRDADKKLEDKDYDGALEAYEKAYKEYRDLSWDVYCQFQSAKALEGAGKGADALVKLESLVGYRKVNPKNEAHLADAYVMLVEKYMANKEFDKALPVTASLSKSANEDVASSAFMTRGRILRAKADVTGKKDDMKLAALAYFQAALLFPKSKNNSQALLDSYHILVEAKDARAEKFADLIKKNYPNSDAAKQLK